MGVDFLFGSDTGWRTVLHQAFLASKVKPHESPSASEAKNDVNEHDQSGVSLGSDEVTYPQWRTRAALLDSFAELLLAVDDSKRAESAGSDQDEFLDFVLEFWLLGLCDDTYIIRAKAVRLLGALAHSNKEYTKRYALPVLLELRKHASSVPEPGSTVEERDTKSLHVKKLLDMLDQPGGPPRYFLRITFLQCCAFLSDIADLWKLLEQHFVMAFDDKVCNVRLEACAQTMKLKCEVTTDIKKKLKTLTEQDSDQEVKKFAESALKTAKH